MVGGLCIGVVEVDCAGVVDMLVLGRVFVVEVMEWSGSGSGVCCEASPVVCKWEGILLGLFELVFIEMNGH